MRLPPTALVVMLLASPASAQELCPFVSQLPNEPPLVLDFSGGTGVVKHYVAGLNEETVCNLQQSWPVMNPYEPYENPFLTRYTLQCDGRLATLAFVASEENGGLDIAVLNGWPYYEDCDF